MKVDVRKLPHSEIEITAEIPADIFESFRSRAVVSLQKNFEMPGFRKGHVPENILLENLFHSLSTKSTRKTKKQ